MHHGNWCGPNWSNGQHRPSVRGTAPAVDEFDETCRQHDFAYADNHDLRSADLLFARQNLGKGAKRTLAALAVGTQGLLRPNDKSYPKDYQTTDMTNKQMLRGAHPSQSKGGGSPGGAVIKQSSVPVSYGTTIRAVKPTLTRTATSARVTGKDFIGTVEGNGVSTFGLGKSALLSPAFFASTFLGNIARSFERYKWNKLIVHYVPKVSTATPGQVILCSSHSVSEPCLRGESGDFLARSMSQGNAVFSPLWESTHIVIDCDNEFRLIDPTTTTDIDDCIYEELQVYVQVGSQQQVGYLFAEYDVSFQEPIYQPHSLSIPIPTGPGARVTLGDTTNVNAIFDDWNLSEVTSVLNLATVPNGSIYRAVLDLQGSSVAVPTTFANAMNIGMYTHTTTGTTAVTTSTIPLVGGLTIYLLVIGATVTAYNSLESAKSGISTGQFFWRTASIAAGSYSFDVALVHAGAAALPTVQ